jgi:hypothetical protein
MATPPRRPAGAVPAGDPVDPGGTRFQAADAVAVTDVDKGWIPTKKWLAALAGTVASIVASWLVTGEFDDVERGMAAAGLVSLVAAYFKGNDLTPGGAPDAKPKVLDLTKEDGAADPGTIIMWALAVLVVFAVVMFIL